MTTELIYVYVTADMCVSCAAMLFQGIAACNCTVYVGPRVYMYMYMYMYTYMYMYMLCYVCVGPYARDRNGAPTPPHRARGPPRRTPNAHSGSGVKISPSAIRPAGGGGGSPRRAAGRGSVRRWMHGGGGGGAGITVRGAPAPRLWDDARPTRTRRPPPPVAWLSPPARLRAPPRAPHHFPGSHIRVPPHSRRRAAVGSLFPASRHS